jgi:predicted NBD/HSP70 family sugar kinase
MAAPHAASPAFKVHEHNVNAVFEILRTRRRTTRTEIGRLSGLSKGTVAGIVGELLESGFATVGGKLQSGRGRSRALLEFNPAARSVVGIQLADDRCTLVLADLDCTVRLRLVRPLVGTDPRRLIDVAAEAVEEARRLAQAPVMGVGVGTPGNIDPMGRRVNIAVSHGWRDLPLAELLESRVKLPVLLANRAKVAALGYLRKGEPGSQDSLIYLYLGRGVVAGIVMDGRLYFGRDGNAGDLGHVTVNPDGALCGCGNRGCLHTVAAEDAILALAREKARRLGPHCQLHRMAGGRLGELTVETLIRAAGQGDEATELALAAVGTQVGLVLANLINTLNPDAVVIGGPTAGFGETLLRPVREEIQRRALVESAAKVDVVASTDDDEAGAVGSAALWIDRAMSTTDGRRAVIGGNDVLRMMRGAGAVAITAPRLEPEA